MLIVRSPAIVYAKMCISCCEAEVSLQGAIDHKNAETALAHLALFGAS